MLIDVHAHCIPAPLAAMLPPAVATALRELPVSDSADDVGRRLGMMDAAAVRMQILSPGVTHYHLPAAELPGAIRALNEAYAALCRRHPDRLGAFGALPLPDVDAAVREVGHCLDRLGMAGIAVHSAIGALSIADAAFDPLFAELNRRGAILFIHPAANGICSAFVNDWKLAHVAGTLIEDALAVMHLLLRRVPQHFPDVRIIIPHLGGLLPMMLERLDNQWPARDLPERPSGSARRFWYDTVDHGSRPALRCACEAFGSERLLPGSDFPFVIEFDGYAGAFAHLRTVELAELDRERILSSNAAALFGDWLRRRAAPA